MKLGISSIFLTSRSFRIYISDHGSLQLPFSFTVKKVTFFTVDKCVVNCHDHFGFMIVKQNLKTKRKDQRCFFLLNLIFLENIRKFGLYCFSCVSGCP